MEQFDVFLAHNSQDKPEVQLIAAALRQRNLKPWIDYDQIAPGSSFQDEIQQAIPLVKSAAIFIGERGLGRWQDWELKSLMQRCVEKGIPVIPVLLPGVKNIPEKFVFLEQFRWVSFSQHNDERALDLLEWGITGIKPKPKNLIENTDTQGEDDLSSEVDVYYYKLRDLLAAKKWKEADRETYRVMIEALGKKDGDYFTGDELLKFPCTDLRTINRLWVKYSNGHFGFSVQKEIYLSVSGKADGKSYEEAWEKFGDRVGWRVENEFGKFWIYYFDVTFDTSSPSGHLPVDWWVLSSGGFFPVGLDCLFSRIKTCKV